MSRFQSTHPRGVRLITIACLKLSIRFQSTHPRGVRPPFPAHLRRSCLFQSTHPRGVRPAESGKRFLAKKHFNPRTHVGCDICRQNTSCQWSHFNPRTHVGCDIALLKIVRMLRNFNPRTHVGCDVAPVLPVGRGVHISIHAPTWGATYSSSNAGWVFTFQSTHPRGVRHSTKHLPAYYRQFQSTHPRGVRRADVISYSDLFGKFQSTHPRGVRHYCLIAVINQVGFQSTHPRGVRHIMIGSETALFNFNPRTHVGCDSASRLTCLTPIISIHAPTWGATTAQDLLKMGVEISIHAPTWGATKFYVNTEGSLEFQSTHPRGVRLIIIYFLLRYRTFQSTHPRGVRRLSLSFCKSSIYFNPRTHVGCDFVPCRLLYGGWQFQSTHPRGVRLIRQPISPIVQVFQSTHPRGVRP